MTTWIDAQRVRCGPLTDAATMFAASLGVECDPPAGVAALRSLAQALHTHLLDPRDSADERLFVELAGSYLGVVLCDALAQGSHERRDGRHGLLFASGEFFDPFLAIERVLDGDDIRASLANEVARVEVLARGQADANWLSIRANLLPRIVGKRFFERLGAEAMRVFAVPLVADLCLTLLLRERGRARYVLHSEAARWPVTPAAIKRNALANLARSSERAQFLRHDGDSFSYVTARTGDGLDAARLLLPGLYDVLAPELGSPFVAAIPHRDALLACALDSSQTIAALRKRVAFEAERSAHAISDQLFLVEKAGRLRTLPS